MVPQGDLTAPVRTWKQEDAFDSTRACEDAKCEGLDNMARWDIAKAEAAAKAGRDVKDDKEWEKNVNEYRAARCIPADFIYPPKKPAQQ